jgi:hypothetical protein
MTGRHASQLTRPLDIVPCPDPIGDDADRTRHKLELLGFGGQPIGQPLGWGLDLAPEPRLLDRRGDSRAEAKSKWPLWINLARRRVAVCAAGRPGPSAPAEGG